MKGKRKVWLVVGVIVALLLVVAGYAVLAGNRFFTRDLVAGEVEQSEAGHHYVLDFFSGDGGSRVANVYVTLWSSGSLCSIKVFIWHEEGTKIDDLSLRFSPMQNSEALAIQAYPSADYPPMVFEGTYDDGVLCRFEDMGFFGEGSLAFQFLLQKDIMYTPSSQPDEIWLEADFGMHSNGPFEFTRQRAQGAICLEIP